MVIIHSHKEVVKIIYGYARVSTRKQWEGNGIDEQIRRLLLNGATKIFEEQFTGSTTNRVRFNELLKILKNGDTLMVTSLDRFARTLIEGLETIDKLMSRGVIVHILNLGILDNSPSSKLTMSIFFAFAEFERSIIQERTMAGREIARTKEGYREGRPKKYSKDQLDHAMSLLDYYSYSKVSKMTGISISTLTREKRKRREIPQ